MKFQSERSFSGLLAEGNSVEPELLLDPERSNAAFGPTLGGGNPGRRTLSFSSGGRTTLSQSSVNSLNILPNSRARSSSTAFGLCNDGSEVDLSNFRGWARWADGRGSV